MTEKRFTITQKKDYFYVRDEINKKPMGMFEFKQNEFPVYFCFHKIIDLLNEQHKQIQQLKEEKKLLKNKLDRIEDILPHFLSCAEISEFHSKTFKEDIALMKCWNKRYQK